MNNEWISVKDRLPEEGEEILIFNPGPDSSNISIGYRKHEFFFDLIDFTMAPVNITYWMPLPELPK